MPSNCCPLRCLVDCEEWFYILLGSLPSARRAIVCILFSLEQNQVDGSCRRSNLRFFAELVDLLRLAQVLKERFLMLVVLELLDQPLDFVLTCDIFLLDCRKYYRNCVIHGVVESLDGSQDDLASWLRESR